MLLSSDAPVRDSSAARLMSSAPISIAGGFDSRQIGFVLCLVACAMTSAWFASPATAQSSAVVSHNKAVEAGRELFEREWTYLAPDIPEQRTIEDSQYEKLLKLLPGDGLGPMFNAKSCAACHAGGAGADVNRNVTLITLDPRSPALVRASQRRAVSQEELDRQTKKLESDLDDLFPGFVSAAGRLSMDVVVHESSTRPFYEPIRQQLTNGVVDGIEPEWFQSDRRTSQAIADRPVIAGRRGELDFYLSQRNSPPLFGLGLIDKILIPRLLTIARVQPARSSGKVTGRLGDGKFGWRGQTVSLQSFVQGACAGELGLQLPGTPQSPDIADLSYISLGDDMGPTQVGQLASYVASLPEPTQWQGNSSEDAIEIRHGKRLFGKIGCAICHVETITPARGIYSDLLLHDMGELLQAPSPASPGRLASLNTIRTPRFPREGRSFGSGSPVASYYGGGRAIRAFTFQRPKQPQFPYGRLPLQAIETKNQKQITWDVLQREWRTPPLWGVADSAPYLHDGRATTLDAAIRWHGGEASDSVTEYRSLPKAEREQLVRFLKSLRAPTISGEPELPLPNAEQRLATNLDFTSQESGALADTQTPPSGDELLDLFNQAY